MAFGLATLPKILLNTRPHHYGFALAMPGTLVLATAALGWLPQWAQKRHCTPSVVTAVVLALLTLAAAAYLSLSSIVMDRRLYPVGEGRDLFFADARGEIVQRSCGAA